MLQQPKQDELKQATRELKALVQTKNYSIDRVRHLAKRFVTKQKDGKMKLPETLAEELRNANKTDKLNADQLQSICEGVVDNWADDLVEVAES